MLYHFLPSLEKAVHSGLWQLLLLTATHVPLHYTTLYPEEVMVSHCNIRSASFKHKKKRWHCPGVAFFFYTPWFQLLVSHVEEQAVNEQHNNNVGKLERFGWLGFVFSQAWICTLLPCFRSPTHCIQCPLPWPPSASGDTADWTPDPRSLTTYKFIHVWREDISIFAHIFPYFAFNYKRLWLLLCSKSIKMPLKGLLWCSEGVKCACV